MDADHTPKSPSKLHVYIDFDRTLFDTPKFGDDLNHLIAVHARVSPAQARMDAAPFYTHATLRSFDFEGYVAAYGLSPDTMLEHVRQLVHANNYLYDDSVQFIEALQTSGFTPKILSFGEDRFQRAKIIPTFTHLLGSDNADYGDSASLETYVILEPKGQHIALKHPSERGVLVDDIPDQQLPPGFSEIHLMRGSTLKQPQSTASGFTISDLAQAYAAIMQLVSQS